MDSVCCCCCCPVWTSGERQCEICIQQFLGTVTFYGWFGMHVQQRQLLRVRCFFLYCYFYFMESMFPIAMKTAHSNERCIFFSLYFPFLFDCLCEQLLTWCSISSRVTTQPNRTAMCYIASLHAYSISRRGGGINALNIFNSPSLASHICTLRRLHPRFRLDQKWIVKNFPFQKIILYHEMQ